MRTEPRSGTREPTASPGAQARCPPTAERAPPLSGSRPAAPPPFHPGRARAGAPEPPSVAHVERRALRAARRGCSRTPPRPPPARAARPARSARPLRAPAAGRPRPRTGWHQARAAPGPAEAWARRPPHLRGTRTAASAGHPPDDGAPCRGLPAARAAVAPGLGVLQPPRPERAFPAATAAAAAAGATGRSGAARRARGPQRAADLAQEERQARAHGAAGWRGRGPAGPPATGDAAAEQRGAAAAGSCPGWRGGRQAEPGGPVTGRRQEGQPIRGP